MGEKCGDHVEEVKGQCPSDLSSRGHFPGDQAVDMRASGTSREGAFLPLVMAAQALRGIERLGRWRSWHTDSWQSDGGKSLHNSNMPPPTGITTRNVWL